MHIYLVLTLLLCLSTSANSGFESLNLDPQLVQRTNNAIACAKAELSKYDCTYLDGYFFPHSEAADCSALSSGA